MRRMKLGKTKIATICLVCAISFSALENGQAYASEIQNREMINECSQITNGVNYEEYAQQVYEKIKENINGTEPFIDTGIQIKREELSDLTFYIQLYFLGRTPDIYYMCDRKNPSVGNIQIKRDGVKTCIEEHDAAIKQLQEIASSISEMGSADEKIAYYAKLLYESNTYDYSLVNTTAYQLLKNKKGVCHAYTIAFGWLCKLSNIPVLYIEGNMDGMPHAWNQVKLSNGEWMYIDVTNLFISPSQTYIEKEYYKKHFSESMRYVMHRTLK